MADAKITALTALTTLLGTDILPVVSDPGGTPVTKKITAANIAAYLAAVSETLTNKTLTSPIISGAGATTAAAHGFDATDHAILIGNGTSNLPIHIYHWKVFTPSWSGLTVGAGTNSGKYCQIGKTIHFQVIWAFGAGAAVGSNPTLTLPVAASVHDAGMPIGRAMYYVAGGNLYHGIIQYDGKLKGMAVSGSNIIYLSLSATAPATWQSGDSITISGTYEAS